MQDNGSPGKLLPIRTPDSLPEDQSKVSPGKNKNRLAVFLIVALLVVILDQLSKLWIDANRPHTELLPGFLDLVYVENTGAIFGLLHTNIQVFIGLGIAASIAILVFLYYFRPATTLGTVSFALILSGAVGNLIDRIRLGYVIDFVRLHLQDLFSWPAFNVADTALTVGLVTLIYYLYQSGVFRKADERRLKPQD